MTKKFKNIAVISGTSILCVAMICVIAIQFGKERTQPDYTAVETKPTEMNVSIVTSLEKDEQAPDITTEAVPDETVASTTPVYPENDMLGGATTEEESAVTATSPPAKEVNQDFELATKPSLPPPPEIKDEAVLTDTSKEPEYEEEQTVITTAPPEEQPKNGQINGDKIYVQGFGWIDYEGGGGIGEVNEQMYQNGNKIGYFG